MGPPWRIDPTTHRTMSEHSYHGATSRYRTGGRTRVWSQRLSVLIRPNEPLHHYDRSLVPSVVLENEWIKQRNGNATNTLVLLIGARVSGWDSVVLSSVESFQTKWSRLVTHCWLLVLNNRTCVMSHGILSYTSAGIFSGLSVKETNLFCQPLRRLQNHFH